MEPRALELQSSARHRPQLYDIKFYNLLFYCLACLVNNTMPGITPLRVTGYSLQWRSMITKYGLEKIKEFRQKLIILTLNRQLMWSDQMWSRECWDGELIAHNTFYTSFGGNMENKINNARVGWFSNINELIWPDHCGDDISKLSNYKFWFIRFERRG